MTSERRTFLTASVFFFLFVISAGLGWAGEEPAAAPSRTQVVVLGTGTPIADPERSGPAVAIVVNGVTYLVDCGPGVVRRAAAAERDGIAALAIQNLKIVFITHLHSDHTLGYPDLIFTPWVLHRAEPLTAYGPRGLQEMTEHVEKAWKKDIYVRTHGLEEANPTGYKVVVHEISPGVIYSDGNVKVTAFLVKHGIWDQAFGYRFDTSDRRIVISGRHGSDRKCGAGLPGVRCAFTRSIQSAPPRMNDAHWNEYFKRFHTSPAELGDIARRAHPRLLVLYHQVLGELPESDLVEQMHQAYAGEFVSAKDLGVY